MAKNNTTQLEFITRATLGKNAFVTKLKTAYNRTVIFIKKWPLRSFYILLALLLLVLMVGRLMQRTSATKAEQAVTKTVNVYSIGESPKAAFQAKIEKSGVVKIIAQTAGVVQSISVKEGDKVFEGQQLVSLANNYQGGNAASIQRQIAQTQYQNVLDTFDKQNDLIQKQKDIATASADNAQQSRDITNQSTGETSDLINANQAQLDQIKQTLTSLQANNVGGANDTQIATLQGTANQIQGGINQLNQGLRSAQYQASNDKPPAQLANLQKDIALKQLEVQQKSLELSKEVSRLQVSLAYVAESTMYPATPFTGTVERINVHPGQLVSPGTVLATVTANDIETTAILLVPQEIAQFLANGEPSEIVLGNKTIAVTPFHVATQATDGQLYAVTYDIPQDQQKNLTDGEYVTIRVPIGTVKTTSADPLIPIDTVYISQENAQILVAQKNKAVTRTVTLGKVFGSYVEVLTGIKNGDQIITDRNVVAGDSIKLNQSAQ